VCLKYLHAGNLMALSLVWDRHKSDIDINEELIHTFLSETPVGWNVQVSTLTCTFKLYKVSKDEMGIPDASHLDGTVSSLYAKHKGFSIV